MEYANNENNTEVTLDRGLFNIVSAAVLKGIKGQNPRQISPLVLAYIGDAVYEMYVRTMLVETTTLSVHGLHLRAAKLVCAKAQAAAFRIIEPMLTEEEREIFKRGRNAHMGTVPKNARILDYRHATGVESLIGYLYLLGRDERIGELIHMMISEQDVNVGLDAAEKNNDRNCEE